MHDFELRKHLRVLRERLESLGRDLGAAVQDLSRLESGLEELEARRKVTIGEAVDSVDGMRLEQRQHIDVARQRGQGAGLYKALDEASELDQEQARLLDEARRKPESDGARDVLRRYTDLERQQIAVISDEIGKFEAQGLRPLFERYRELAEQQQRILLEILGTPHGQ